ncbi:GIY-YIG nuclease family protein [Niabella yanshanensis]|uniref:GIY-YIG nuclease family protein n=1 Tax=Niabella yanshanensis TaxID=577386 RepID=UPI000E0ADE42
MYYAYILKGKDNRYYYGSCQDLEKRLATHNQGKVKSTKYRRPLVVHYFEKFATRSEAFRREMFFKSIDGYLWLRSQEII